MKKTAMISKGHLARELDALHALSDEEIDASEIPERTDFSDGRLGKFFHLTSRDYDVRAIANWCILRAKKQSLEISNLWLNKIVYFIYEEALQLNNIILTGAKAEAWDHGPVFREVYFGFKTDKTDQLLMSFDPLKKKRVAARADFLKSDIAIFEGVWDRLAHLPAFHLRNISHKSGQPWHTTWNYTGKSNPGMVIDIATILEASHLRYRGNS